MLWEKRQVQVAPAASSTREQRRSSDTPVETRSSTAATAHSTALSSFQMVVVAVIRSRQRWRESAAQVVWSLLLVLRNACISVAFAWFVMLCISQGNIFSGRAPKHQSARVFVGSVVLWSKFFSWVCMAATYSVSLLSQRFAKAPDVHPNFITCWLKVLRGTVSFVVLTTIVTVASLVVAFQVSNRRVRALRIHVYFNALWFHLDTVACGIEAARIFESETVRGQARQRACPRQRPPYWKQLLRMFAATLSTTLSYFVAALYTHVTSSVVIDSPSELLTFTLASFGLKILLQEVAKHVVFKQRVHSVIVMAGTVSVPTILVDTQARVVLLLAASTSATLSGTLVMALMEVAFRCLKSFHVKHKIKREQARQAASAATSEQSARTSSHTASANLNAAASTNGRPFPLGRQKTESFDTWRLRLLRYHATEVYSDMLAEHVALGCSYVILFFCWNHPKYMLRRFRESEANDVSSTVGSSSSGTDGSSTRAHSLSSILSSSQAIIMACQLGAEIVVDFASCLLEVGNGIDFRPLQRQSFFLAVLLIWAATGNITIAANMFVQVGD